ncbi:Tim44/TimA family putative adaptor protein [Devosia chinhatensis]|uniref:Tim44/TimA family putative adaptor protein n=1 Tax=Devosia aurantiaca TaxID=2714858 RepID=A0A6M1SHR2_9HYPH|nr:Tim44/TimA family putative adaptor protein [Devosia aurantiaca]
MDDFLDLPTLIAIVVAVFVLFRLRSVLGTRTGTERPPVDRSRSTPVEKKAGTEDDTVVPMRPRSAQPELDDERRARKLEAEIEQHSRGDEALKAGLKTAAEADATFTPKSFLEGAKQAYEMIVTAYAEGDRQTLKNLSRQGHLRELRPRYQRPRSGRPEGRFHLCRPAQDRNLRSRIRRQERLRHRALPCRSRVGNARQGWHAGGRQCRPGANHRRRMDLCAQSQIARSELESRLHQPARLIFCGGCFFNVQARHQAPAA